MPASPDRASLEAAAEWYAALREAGPESPVHAAHGTWLHQDPEHRRAWARIEKLNAALEGAPAGIVQPTLKQARAARRQTFKLLLAVVGLGALLGGWLQTPWHQRLTADHYTATGERSAVRLDDGSLLELNTASAVDVHFDDERRRIHLEQGEIRVTTAADDAARPFIVTTGQGRVRALGTRFLVRQDEDATRVTVMEHAVAIRPAAAPELATRVDTGFRARFTGQRVGRIEPIAGHPAAWTRGQLIASDWPLGRFLDELARYHEGVLSYDEAAAGLRLSGAFHLHDTDAVLDNLAATLPVRIRRFTPYWTRVEPREPE